MYTLKSLSFPHLIALDLALVLLSILYCQWNPDDCWKILCVRCFRHSRHIASSFSIVSCRLMEAETADPPFLYFSGEKIWFEDRKIRPIHRLSPNPLQTALPQIATSLFITEQFPGHLFPRGVDGIIAPPLYCSQLLVFIMCSGSPPGDLCDPGLSLT